MITLAYSIEAPLWAWLVPVLTAVGIVVADRHRARSEAEAFVVWQDQLWRRWQTSVARHAEHYDRYWGEVCSGLVRVYLDRAGDAHLHDRVRGALVQGTPVAVIAHGLAATYADNPDFVRDFRAFADRPDAPTPRSTHGK